MLFTFTYMVIPGKPVNASPPDLRLLLALIGRRAGDSRCASRQDKINRKSREFPANSPKNVPLPSVFRGRHYVFCVSPICEFRGRGGPCRRHVRWQYGHGPITEGPQAA
jgi:hypothetical protein